MKLVVVGNEGMLVFDDTKSWDQKLALYPHSAKTIESQPVLKKLVSLDSTTFFQSLDLHSWFSEVSACTGLITKHQGLRGPGFCLFGRLLSIKDLHHV